MTVSEWEMIRRLDFVMEADKEFGHGNVDHTTAERYLKVVSCLPRLAPRRATDIALALQDHDWQSDAAFAACRRDRNEVPLKGWAHPTLHRRTLNRALLAVLVPLLAAADMRLPCRDS